MEKFTETHAEWHTALDDIEVNEGDFLVTKLVRESYTRANFLLISPCWARPSV